MQIQTIVYRDHSLVGRSTAAGWQVTITGTGRHTGLHRDMASAIKEAQDIVDTALDWKRQQS